MPKESTADNPDPFGALPRESLVDLAARQVKTAILSGALKPGAAVQVAELTKRFGISHIPVREALRRLEGEGLITATAQRTPVVTSLSLEDFTAVLDLRTMIEVPTAIRALELATEEDVAALRESCEVLAAASDDTTSEAYWVAHREFHWRLLAPGANAWTRTVLQPLWTGNERYIRLYVSASESRDLTIELHRHLLTAVEQRDPDLMAANLRYHFSIRDRWIEGSR